MHVKTRFQSKRMDDQRCSLAEPREPEALPGAAKHNGVQPKQKEEIVGQLN